MRKYTGLLSCALAVALLLSGCLPAPRSTPDQEPEQAPDEQWEGDWDALEDSWSELDGDWSAKGHYWKVLDSAGREEILTVQGEEAVKRVDDLVQGDMEWDQASGVEDASPLYVYVFMQQKTPLAGQAEEAERAYEEVLRFTVYEDSDVLSMTVLKGLGDALPPSLADWADILTICVRAPAETAEALRDPSQFAES